MNERVERLRARLEEPLIVTNPVNVRYLTGFASSNAALVVDAERAWEAMRRDKKAADGKIRLVLLPRNGHPEWPVELPDAEVRRELERLIA